MTFALSNAARSALLVAASVMIAGSARADERVECASAYEQTQRFQQKSELVAALDTAERCARPSCPALLKDECARWVTEVRAKVPAVVVRVRSTDGCMHTIANVEAGGMSRKDPASDATLIDPGSHDLKIVDPVSARVKTQTLDFLPGDRRDLTVDFGPRDAICGKPAAGDRTTSFMPSRTLVLAGIGGGLVLTGATLGLIGVAKRSDLDECKPACAQDRIDAVSPFFVAGDVVAGIGVLVLGAALVNFLALEKARAATSFRVLASGAGIGATF